MTAARRASVTKGGGSGGSALRAAGSALSSAAVGASSASEAEAAPAPTSATSITAAAVSEPCTVTAFNGSRRDSLDEVRRFFAHKDTHSDPSSQSYKDPTITRAIGVSETKAWRGASRKHAATRTCRLRHFNHLMSKHDELRKDDSDKLAKYRGGRVFTRHDDDPSCSLNHPLRGGDSLGQSHSGHRFNHDARLMKDGDHRDDNRRYREHHSAEAQWNRQNNRRGSGIGGMW